MGQPCNCLPACSCQVCSARVDVRSGDLYWLACNRRDIGVIQTSDMSPRILHHARSSIQHLFLDWQHGVLYWLAHGQPLQALSLEGGAPWDAWNETWPGDLPAAMDSRAFSILWSSALGEPSWCLEQGVEVLDVGRSDHPCPTCSKSLPGQWDAHGADSVLWLSLWPQP